MINESKWTADKRYADTFHSQFGEMVELYKGPGWLTIEHGWYYWPCGSLTPKGPFKTAKRAMACSERPVNKRWRR
jgi:hypothetical protein